MKFSLAGLIVAIAWAWFSTATMKVQGAGSISGLIYIIVFPLQLAFISAALFENFQLYQLSLFGKIALSLLAMFIAVVLPALSFTDNLSPIYGSSSSNIVFFAPSITLGILAGMALLSRWLPGGLQILNTSLGLGVVFCSVLTSVFFSFDRGFLVARSQLSGAQGREKVHLFHKAYAKEIHINVRYMLSALIHNSPIESKVSHVRYDEENNFLIVARRFPLTDVAATREQLKQRFTQQVTVNAIQIETISPQYMLEWTIPMATITGPELLERLNTIATYEP